MYNFHGVPIALTAIPIPPRLRRLLRRPDQITHCGRSICLARRWPLFCSVTPHTTCDRALSRLRLDCFSPCGYSYSLGVVKMVHRKHATAQAGCWLVHQHLSSTRLVLPRSPRPSNQVLAVRIELSLPTTHSRVGERGIPIRAAGLMDQPVSSLRIFLKRVSRPVSKKPAFMIF
jgi:hypothetical protein